MKYVPMMRRVLSTIVASWLVLIFSTFSSLSMASAAGVPPGAPFSVGKLEEVKAAGKTGTPRIRVIITKFANLDVSVYAMPSGAMIEAQSSDGAAPTTNNKLTYVITDDSIKTLEVLGSLTDESGQTAIWRESIDLHPTTPLEPLADKWKIRFVGGEIVEGEALPVSGDGCATFSGEATLVAGGKTITMPVTCDENYLKFPQEMAATYGQTFEGKLSIGDDPTAKTVDLTVESSETVWFFSFLLGASCLLGLAISIWRGSARRASIAVREVSLLKRSIPSAVSRFKTISGTTFDPTKSWTDALDTLGPRWQVLRRQHQFDLDAADGNLLTEYEGYKADIQGWPEVADKVKKIVLVTRASAFKTYFRSLAYIWTGFETAPSMDLAGIKVVSSAKLADFIRLGEAASDLQNIDADLLALSANPEFDASARAAFGAEVKTLKYKLGHQPNVSELLKTVDSDFPEIYGTWQGLKETYLKDIAGNVSDLETGEVVVPPTEKVCPDWPTVRGWIFDVMTILAFGFVAVFPAFALLYSNDAYGSSTDVLLTVAWGLGGGFLSDSLRSALTSVHFRKLSDFVKP
jgi:hypothetical protein